MDERQLILASQEKLQALRRRVHADLASLEESGDHVAHDTLKSLDDRLASLQPLLKPTVPIQKDTR